MYLRAHGILAGTIAPQTVRLVTHHDVDDDGIERACRALAGAP
jgi:threonine aldolase